MGALQQFNVDVKECESKYNTCVFYKSGFPAYGRDGSHTPQRQIRVNWEKKEWIFGSW